MMPISVAPVTEPRYRTPAIDKIQIQEELFDVFDITTPSMMASSVKTWVTLPVLKTFFCQMNSDEYLVHRDHPQRQRHQEN